MHIKPYGDNFFVAQAQHNWINLVHIRSQVLKHNHKTMEVKNNHNRD